MFLLICGLAIAAILIATGRIWMEFTQRSAQFTAEIAKYGQLIEAHTLRLEDLRSQSEAVKEQIDILAIECQELDANLVLRRDELEPLEDLLERRRPNLHRFDIDDPKGPSWLR